MSDRLRLELPATHESVRVARDLLRRFARLRGIPDEERDTLALVVSELLSNAVDHGGGGAAMDETELAGGASMKLSLELDARRWRLQVSDQGGGDPAEFRRAVEDVDVPDPEDDRGRGLFLLRATVDRLEVDASEDGRGLRFTATREHAGP